MQTIFNCFRKNIEYPSPLKFFKIPVFKEIERNKDQKNNNKSSSFGSNRSKYELPEELIDHFEDEKKKLKVGSANKCYRKQMKTVVYS